MQFCAERTPTFCRLATRARSGCSPILTRQNAGRQQWKEGTLEPLRLSQIEQALLG